MIFHLLPKTFLTISALQLLSNNLSITTSSSQPLWHTFTMRQVLLFFIVLFALLPFIRAFRCGAQTNITFVPDVAAALAQYGDFNESSLGLRKRGTNVFDQGADKVGTDLRQPWPVWPRHNNQNPHVIHYCYETPYVRSRLNCVVTEAIDRWYRKLNSGVFRDKTDIKFREYHNSAGMPHYCFDGRQPVGWNQRVRPDALRISLDYTRLIGAQATLGYEVAGNWKAGRHQLAMAEPSANHHLLNVLIVTHEVRRQLSYWKDLADISIACTWSV